MKTDLYLYFCCDSLEISFIKGCHYVCNFAWKSWFFCIGFWILCICDLPFTNALVHHPSVLFIHQHNTKVFDRLPSNCSQVVSLGEVENYEIWPPCVADILIVLKTLLSILI